MSRGSSPSKLKIYPDKNIPKLEYSYFSSKFYVESEFGMPKLPSLGHFEIFDNFWRPLYGGFFMAVI